MAPRKIIPVKTCPSRERSRSAAFATFSRNRSIFVAAEGRDGDRLRLAVGELSKPRRRLLPVANPERTSFSLSPFLASFLSVLCFNGVDRRRVFLLFLSCYYLYLLKIFGTRRWIFKLNFPLRLGVHENLRRDLKNKRE